MVSNFTLSVENERRSFGLVEKSSLKQLTKDNPHNIAIRKSIIRFSVFM